MKVIISCPDSYGKETVFVSVLRADHVLMYRTFYPSQSSTRKDIKFQIDISMDVKNIKKCTW
jgi:hypothetical protein